MRSRKYLKGGVTTVEQKVEPKPKPVLQEDKCVKQSDECIKTCKKTAATCATKEIEENKVNAGATGATGATEVRPGLFDGIKKLFGNQNEVAAKKDNGTVAKTIPQVATPTESKGGKRKSKPKSRKRKSKRKPRQRKSRKN